MEEKKVREFSMKKADKYGHNGSHWPQGRILIILWPSEAITWIDLVASTISTLMVSEIIFSLLPLPFLRSMTYIFLHRSWKAADPVTLAPLHRHGHIAQADSSDSCL